MLHMYLGTQHMFTSLEMYTIACVIHMIVSFYTCNMYFYIVMHNTSDKKKNKIWFVYILCICK